MAVETGGAADEKPTEHVSEFEGVFDAIDDGAWISGWARDHRRPDQPVEIEVLVDESPIGRYGAADHRGDLAERGWGDCAFRIRIPDVYRDGARHRVDVRFAGAGTALRHSPRSLEARARLAGVLDAVKDGQWICGWARDVDNPARRLEIDLLVDGTPAGRHEAGDRREDLARRGWGDCAFRIALPDGLNDGREHSIDVRFAGTGEPLENSPLTFLAEPEAAPVSPAASNVISLAVPAPAAPARRVELRGQFDAIEEDGWIAGWAQQADGSPVVLGVYIDDNLVDTVSADQYRSDLRKNDLGDCAFWFRIPKIFNDGETHEVRLREVSSGEPLTGSPRTFSFQPTGAMTDGGKNVFPNAGLTSWPNGLVVAPTKRLEEIAEGWFFDMRRGTSPDIVFAADKPVDIALAKNEYAMKVSVAAGGNDGYMRLVVPLPIKPETLDQYRFSLGLRCAATGTTLHVIEIFLATQENGSIERVSTIRRAVKQRGTVRLTQLPLLREERPGDIDSKARLCIVIDLRGEGELVLFSPSLNLSGQSRPGDDAIRIGEFEDPRIREQVRHIRLSQVWQPVAAVPGPLGGPPVPASTAREARALLAVPFIQIVVPVFNAALDVEALLDSIVRSTRTPFEVLIVDDGSAPYTASRVAAWQHFDPRIRYLSNEENLGYTRNINRGLQLAVADFVVLINSDTIVTQHWLEKMFEVMAADDTVAAVGPLSNAASWQSIPRTKGPDGDWIVNSFDSKYTPDEIARVLEALHDGSAPEFPLLNGFCTLFRKKALEEVGYFNDAAFPMGYGEENDLCLRLGRAGWTLRLATDVYVHHAKSKSFGNARRRELSGAANRILRDRHPEVDFPTIEERMRTDPSMVRIRRELAGLVKVERAYAQKPV